MELVTLLLLASRLMTDAVHEQLARDGFAGLRPAHGFAFQLLSSGGATGVELADHLGISRQAAGQMVDDLARLGYVTRTADPVDARLRRVVLTAQGREAVAASVRRWREQEVAWADRIGPEAMTSLKAGLRDYVDQRDGSGRPLRLRPVW